MMDEYTFSDLANIVDAAVTDAENAFKASIAKAREIFPRIGKCANCEHWNERGAAYQDMGLCGAIPEMREWKEEEPAFMLSFIRDCEDHDEAPKTSAQLETEANFGCTLFKAKPGD